jgi:hypothetical protein
LMKNNPANNTTTKLKRLSSNSWTIMVDQMITKRKIQNKNLLQYMTVIYRLDEAYSKSRPCTFLK